MIEETIEAARAELYAIASLHGHNFQHEDVLAASRRLDALIVEGQQKKLQERRRDPNDRHRRRERSFDLKPVPAGQS